MLFSPQLPLQLEPHRDHRFEDFVAGPNAAALAALERVPGQGECSLFLHGASGTGKTHLLRALCLATRDAGQTAFYVGLGRLPDEALGSLRDLEGLDVICVDDLHRVIGRLPWEEALFHCFNRVRAVGGRLVVASRERRSALSFALPDLASRLGWGLSFHLAPLPDADKREVLRRHAELLGIDLPVPVQDYLLKHGHRNLGRLLLALERLQQAAFADKRRITVPLARRVLNEA